MEIDQDGKIVIQFIPGYTEFGARGDKATIKVKKALGMFLKWLKETNGVSYRYEFDFNHQWVNIIKMTYMDTFVDMDLAQKLHETLIRYFKCSPILMPWSGLDVVGKCSLSDENDAADNCFLTSDVYVVIPNCDDAQISSNTHERLIKAVSNVVNGMGLVVDERVVLTGMLYIKIIANSMISV